MELRIVEDDKSSFPLKGLLICGASLKDCIHELQRLELPLADIQIYPVPGMLANSIWGYLIASQNPIPKDKTGKHQLCQSLCTHLMIPERSMLFPLPLTAELDKLFASGLHVAHPDFGWVELSEPLNLPELIEQPGIEQIVSTKPAPGVFVPRTIRSFQIHPISPEEVLQHLENEVFPKHKKFEDHPLSPLEKLRLKFYQLLLQKGDNANDKQDGAISNDEKPSLLQKLFKSFTKDTRLQEDFRDLEERNRKSVDKLMDLLKKDPEQGLQYAIPLDETGVTRGSSNAQLDLSKRWFDFSLQSRSGNNVGSGSAQLGDHFHELQKQYRLTAEELMKKKDYQKAAFVYMKLLKEYRTAAQTLEAGKYYQDAATIYLKHLSDKQKAAECYEKGNSTMEAINLYSELGQHEKIGDLYSLLSNRRQAIFHYEKVVESYTAKGQYVKASLIYKHKINDAQAGQSMLLEGWRQNKDAVNCLNNYFSNIEDSDQFRNELQAVHQRDVNEKNAESFLEAVRHEYQKRNELRESIMELAYEVVSRNISTNPAIVSELKNFNINNKELFKDTLRFKLQARQKK